MSSKQFCCYDMLQDTSLDEAAGLKSNKANQTVAGAPGQQGTPIVSSWNRARVYSVKQHASKNQIISNKEYIDINSIFCYNNRVFLCITSTV